MTTETDIRQSFLAQAESCDALGSPFTARLCRLAAARLEKSEPVASRILTWGGDPSSRGDALALRLAGALHALVLTGADSRLVACYPPAQASDSALWSACTEAFGDHTNFILERLRYAPQTNEVRRSGALLPGFLTIARLFGKPLVLSEIGASAGLNLQWDRYAYELGGLAWGDIVSSVLIAPRWSGSAPPDAKAHVMEREGCDLNPLDPSSPEDRLRLLSYIWADQADRLERTRAALAIAAAHSLTVVKADAIEWLAERLDQNYPGAAHVVYHSIAWQYLPQDARDRGERLIGEAGKRATEEAPLARLQVEADGGTDGAAISLQVWPSGTSHVIGRADFHGRWVKWTGWPD